MLRDSQNIPIAAQRLIFAGKQLEEHRTLKGEFMPETVSYSHTDFHIHFIRLQHPARVYSTSSMQSQRWRGIQAPRNGCWRQDYPKNLRRRSRSIHIRLQPRSSGICSRYQRNGMEVSLRCIWLFRDCTELARLDRLRVITGQDAPYTPVTEECYADEVSNKTTLSCLMYIPSDSLPSEWFLSVHSLVLNV